LTNRQKNLCAKEMKMRKLENTGKKSGPAAKLPGILAGQQPVVFLAVFVQNSSSNCLLYTSFGGTCKNTIGGTLWENL